MTKRIMKLLAVMSLVIFASAQRHQNYSNNQSQNSVLGKWSNDIIVPPSTDVYTNVITFIGEAEEGTFVDQNNHAGSWSIKGDSVTWIYENVPNLDNTFTGKLSKDGKSMNGVNYGEWKGEPFKGNWQATFIE